MGSKVERAAFEGVITIASAVANSTDIPFFEHGALILHFGATWTNATVSAYAKHPGDLTWNPVYLVDGSQMEFTALTSSCFVVQPQVFGFANLRYQSSFAGNNGVAVGFTLKG